MTEGNDQAGVEATTGGDEASQAANEQGISSTAPTQKQKNQGIDPATGADQESVHSAPKNNIIEDTDVDISVNAPPVIQRHLHPTNEAKEDGPYDEEENMAVDSAVPMSHVHPTADDVSSLQHTFQGKQDNRQQGGQHHQHEHSHKHGHNQEGAIAEEESAYYYENDEEQQKALRRRNVLIIIMLLLFLGLVVAIGVGVGMAVKNKNNENPQEVDLVAPDNGDGDAGAIDTDDEYDGRGGGIDEDDVFKTTVPSAFPSNEGPCIPIEIGIIFDEYSGETGWMLIKGNYHPEDPDKNLVVWKSKYYNNLEYDGRADTFPKCFPPGYYTFVFTDQEGDGICCYHGEGSYVLSSEGKVIAIGGEMDSEEESVVFELPFVEPEPVDDDGDGRDDRLGLIMPYDHATNTNNNLTEGVNCENFRLVIMTDQYGIETTWELFEGKDKSGVLIADGGPYGSEYTYVVDYCLASPKQYTLYMYDWDRRGLCCDSGEGWYRVTSGDIVIIENDGQWQFAEENVTSFILPADGSVVFSDEPTQSPTVIVPVGAKTLYPTASPVTLAPSVSPTTRKPTVSPTPPPTKSPTNKPTSSPTKPDQLDTTTMDKEITPFPSLSPVRSPGLTVSPVAPLNIVGGDTGKEDDKKDEDKAKKDREVY